MNQSYIQFKVKSMRMTNIQRTLEALMVMLLALFTMAVLPSLLIQYVYAGQNLLEAPKALEYIPVGAFGISVLYTVFVIITNMNRGKKIAQMEQDLYFTEGSAEEMTSSESDDAELKELEKMVDEAMASHSTTKKTSKKAVGKKRK